MLRTHIHGSCGSLTARTSTWDCGLRIVGDAGEADIVIDFAVLKDGDEEDMIFVTDAFGRKTERALFDGEIENFKSGWV